MHLHDSREKQIIGLVRSDDRIFKMHVYILVWLKSDQIGIHSQIKTRRLFDWEPHYSCMYMFRQIGSDFAFCAGSRFFSRSCEPEVEGQQLRRLSSKITASKSATVHLVCVIIMYTIYEMYKDVASSCSSCAILLECWGRVCCCW